MTDYICPECNGTGIKTINQPGGETSTLPCSNCAGEGITPLQKVQSALDDLLDKVKKVKKTVEDIWDKVK